MRFSITDFHFFFSSLFFHGISNEIRLFLQIALNYFVLIFLYPNVWIFLHSFNANKFNSECLSSHSSRVNMYYIKGHYLCVPRNTSIWLRFIKHIYIFCNFTLSFSLLSFIHILLKWASAKYVHHRFLTKMKESITLAFSFQLVYLFQSFSITLCNRLGND